MNKKIFFYISKLRIKDSNSGTKKTMRQNRWCCESKFSAIRRECLRCCDRYPDAITMAISFCKKNLFGILCLRMRELDKRTVYNYYMSQLSTNPNDRYIEYFKIMQECSFIDEKYAQKFYKGAIKMGDPFMLIFILKLNLKLSSNLGLRISNDDVVKLLSEYGEIYGTDYKKQREISGFLIYFIHKILKEATLKVKLKSKLKSKLDIKANNPLILNLCRSTLKIE